MESRNALFFEHIFPCKSDEGLRSFKRTYETMNEDSLDQNQEQDVEDEPFGPNFLTYLLENEPQSFQEAVNSPEGPLWK